MSRRSTRRPKASGDSAGGAGKAKLPDEAVNILREWLLSPEHVDYPYPTQQEKNELLEKCKITPKQLSNWLVNARKRIWAPLRQRQGKSVVPFAKAKAAKRFAELEAITLQRAEERAAAGLDALTDAAGGMPPHPVPRAAPPHTAGPLLSPQVGLGTEAAWAAAAAAAASGSHHAPAAGSGMTQVPELPAPVAALLDRTSYMSDPSMATGSVTHARRLLEDHRRTLEDRIRRVMAQESALDWAAEATQRAHSSHEVHSILGQLRENLSSTASAPRPPPRPPVSAGPIGERLASASSHPPHPPLHSVVTPSSSVPLVSPHSRPWVPTVSAGFMPPPPPPGWQPGAMMSWGPLPTGRGPPGPMTGSTIGYMPSAPPGYFPNPSHYPSAHFAARPHPSSVDDSSPSGSLPAPLPDSLPSPPLEAETAPPMPPASHDLGPMTEPAAKVARTTPMAGISVQSDSERSLVAASPQTAAPNGSAVLSHASHTDPDSRSSTTHSAADWAGSSAGGPLAGAKRDREGASLAP